jgi:hypothetical protein
MIARRARDGCARRAGFGIMPSRTMSPPLDDLANRTLGEFALRGRIGGGFGVFYRATQRLLGREAAVKVLHRRLDGDTTVLRRFLREPRVASRLDHPYAAHVYATGIEPDGIILAGMTRAPAASSGRRGSMR